MRAYGCYILDEEDHIRHVEVVRAENDEIAIAAANALCAAKYDRYPRFEIFDQARLVLRGRIVEGERAA
jgi:hypothetical protein